MLSYTASPSLVPPRRPLIALAAPSPLRCEVLRGEREIIALREPLRGLRAATRQHEDVTTDPEWFAAMTVASREIPWIVALFQGETPIAAMHLAEKRIAGLPSGYLKADGGFGEDFLLCPREHRAFHLPALLEGLFQKRAALIAHIVELARPGLVPSPAPALSGLATQRRERPSHHRLTLRGTMEETLAHYGSHTRRNLRYYLRKARQEGCRVSLDLNREERFEAVLSLANTATHRVPVEAALRREATLQSTPRSFAMGVRSAHGSWLSYLAGWRQPTRTFVYWQMNRVTDSNTSISTAIRSALLEEEIARGAQEIVFVGGTSPVFQRCCEEDLCVDFIARRRGTRGLIFSRLLKRAVAPDHPLRLSREDAAPVSKAPAGSMQVYRRPML